MPRLLEELIGATVLALPVSASLVTPVREGAAGSVAASSEGSGPSTVRCDVEEGVWNTVAADAVFVDVSCAPSPAGAGIAVDNAGDDCIPPDDIREDVIVPVKEDWTVALPWLAKLGEPSLLVEDTTVADPRTALQAAGARQILNAPPNVLKYSRLLT